MKIEQHFDVNPSQRIEQHYYTRERRGIFRQSEGYDTVAKSPGLDDAFIKEKIHPYCVYSGGLAVGGLATGGTSGGIAGDPSPDNISPAFTLAHYPCGKMLFGRAVFVPADFTRQRSAFFAHNYILPASGVGDVLADIGKLSYTRFDDSYDISYGVQPEALDGLPIFEPKNFPANSENIPSTEGVFLQIAACIMQSLEKSKKTYVLLPKLSKNLPENCNAVFVMLAEIYKHLPEGAKHILGFCTRAREPEKRKGIHLVFLEKEAFRRGDSRFAGDFVIDTEKGIVCGTPPATYINSENYITERIAALPPERFFAEIEFWHGRTPGYKAKLLYTEAAWFDRNLENLTPSQLAAIPPNIINRGKNSATPALYLILSILKKFCEKNTKKNDEEIPLRYFLGSYPLTPEAFARTAKNIRRIRQNSSTPANCEDAEFLSRLNS
ncbi:MAG: hypothetical protein FWF79_07690 [Defluviitaleaceae bacterium]|nr:hypothetical protein [Defluviitaleaceae bacterium]